MKEINLEYENDDPGIPTVAAAVPYQLSGRHQLDHLHVNIEYFDSHLFAFLQRIQATTLEIQTISGSINDYLTYLSPTTTTHLHLALWDLPDSPLSNSAISSFSNLKSLVLDGEELSV